MISNYSALIFIFLGTHCFEYEPYKMKIVTRFDDLERNFQQSRILNLEHHTYTLDSAGRLNACKQIFSAPYFMWKHETYADVEESFTKHTLDKYYPDIQRTFYEKKTRTCILNRLRMYNKTKFEFVLKNEYVIRNVQIQNNVYKVEMFACLVLQLRNQRFKKYFVSRQEPLVGSRSFVKNYVFGYNHKRQLVLEALVEETPNALTETSVLVKNIWQNNSPYEERKIDVPCHYVLKKDARYYAEYDYSKQKEILELSYSRDNVCGKRSDSEKLRICASIMWKFIDEKKTQFWPTKYSVNYTCVKGDIVVGDDVKKRAPYPFRVTKYQEWLLGCRGRDLKENNRFIVYVSQDSASTVSAFAYEKKDNQFIPRVEYSGVSPICH